MQVSGGKYRVFGVKNGNMGRIWNFTGDTSPKIRRIRVAR